MGTGAFIKGKLFIQNTLFVAKNGVNATAKRNRWDKPYATILEAKNNALPGDTIYVFPGTYNEGSADITASDVQYFYEDGALVQCNFEVISDFTLAKNIWIDGAGTFQTLGINFAKAVVLTNNPSTTIYFRGKELIGRTNGFSSFALSSMDFHCDTISTDLQYGIFLSGNCQGTISFNYIETQDAVGILVSNANTDLVRRKVFINGGLVRTRANGFSGANLYTLNSFNTEVHWSGITLEHHTGVAGGLIGLWSGFNYFLNCNGVSDLGYGVQAFSGASVNRFVNCNMDSDWLAFRSESSSQNEIIGGVYASSDDGQATRGALVLSNTSECDIQGATFEQKSADALPSIMQINNSNLRMSNVKLIGSPTITESIRSSAPQNIAVELQCTTNKPTNANITNVVAGTNVIVDANVGRNSSTIY